MTKPIEYPFEIPPDIFVKEMIKFYDVYCEAIRISEESKNPELASWIDGMKKMVRTFLKLCDSLGIKEVPTKIGQPIDLKFHQIEEEIVLPDKEDYEILDEISKGFIFQGKIIRSARVKVARKLTVPDQK